MLGRILDIKPAILKELIVIKEQKISDNVEFEILTAIAAGLKSVKIVLKKLDFANCRKNICFRC